MFCLKRTKKERKKSALVGKLPVLEFDGRIDITSAAIKQSGFPHTNRREVVSDLESAAINATTLNNLDQPISFPQAMIFICIGFPWLIV